MAQKAFDMSTGNKLIIAQWHNLLVTAAAGIELSVSCFEQFLSNRQPAAS
jgi:hypothetical protein